VSEPAGLPHGLLTRLDPLDGLDVRLAPDCAEWVFGRSSGTGRFTGWVRLADGRDPDPMVLLAAMDALPPTSFDHGRVGWLPTVECTAHVHARPAPGWLLVNAGSSVMGDQYVVEDADVWDSRGALVVQSRQFTALA
jgi:hypothetical protein